MRFFKTKARAEEDARRVIQSFDAVAGSREYFRRLRKRGTECQPDARSARTAFVAKHCNIAFVPALSADIMKRNAAAYRKMVKETTGRDIQVWIQVLRSSAGQHRRG